MNLGQLAPSEESLALNWCAAVEEGLRVLKPFWFDQWLRAVGDGPDAIRLLKAERLLPIFRMEQVKIERQVLVYAEQQRIRRQGKG